MNISRRSLMGGTAAALVAVCWARPSSALAWRGAPMPALAGVGEVWGMTFWSRHADSEAFAPPTRAIRQPLRVPDWHPEFN